MKHLSGLDIESKTIIISIIMAISAVLIINYIQEAKAAHFDTGEGSTTGLTVGEDTYDTIETVYPPNREQQIKLMKECMEDSLACRPQERRGKPPTNAWCDMWVQITIAFFNYRTGEK